MQNIHILNSYLIERPIYASFKISSHKTVQVLLETTLVMVYKGQLIRDIV